MAVPNSSKGTENKASHKHLWIIGLAIGMLVLLWQAEQHIHAYIQDPASVSIGFQDLTFDPIDEANETFAVSAYKNQDNRTVRIFVLKKTIANPLIYCFYVGNTAKTLGRVISNSAETFAVRGIKYGFLPLSERPGQYQGFVMYCKIPPDLLESIANGFVAIALHTGSASFKAPVVLPIRLGLPPEESERRNLPRVGLCFVPFTNQPNFDPAHLMEIFELHRTVGVELILFYLGPNSSAQVKQLLQTYVERPTVDVDEKFQFRLVQWQLPNLTSVELTVYHEQLLSYSDCLYRMGPEVEFVFHSSFDEMFVPSQSPTSKRLTRWSNILKVLRGEAYSSRPVTCFPRRFFPNPTKQHEQSVFDRTEATAMVYAERKKCLHRSGEVHVIDLYWPIKPKSFNFMPELGTVFDYGGFTEWDHKAAGPGVGYETNEELAPFLHAARLMKQNRLVDAGNKSDGMNVAHSG